MNKLVSVIVPIYKVEPYLKGCVDSIRNQTYSALEILLVDDGSPDRCGEMCDQFAREDTRIRVIHKENGGLSSARNAGLNAASGKYILFTDSDDQIEPDMVETMVHAMEENEADIVTVNLKSVCETAIAKERVMDIQPGLLEFPQRPDYLRILHDYGPQISIFSWNNLYLRDRIERYGLRFVPTQRILSEDQLFNLCYYASVRRAFFVDRSLYIYQVRAGTLSRSRTPTDILKRRITLILDWMEYLQKNHFPIQTAGIMAFLWSFFVSGCTTLSTAERVLDGIRQIQGQEYVLFRKCLLHMLLGKAGRDYTNRHNMGLRAKLYFKLMLLDMMRGKYDRPVQTYLIGS